jgi:hypothetical protein
VHDFAFRPLNTGVPLVAASVHAMDGSSRAAGIEPARFDLYRDPRERNPLKVQGMWTVAYFGDMRARHMAFKKKFPDRKETHGFPYEGIEHLRPETKAMLERFFAAQKLLK